MKKIYFIYVAIPETTFNTVKYLIDNAEAYRWKHHNMFGLYTWSDDKKLVAEFFEVRTKNIYTLVKKEVDSDELDYIKSKYNTLKLGMHRYYLSYEQTENNSVNVVSTKFEYVAAGIDGEENMFEFGPTCDSSIPYSIFKNKILNALDKIGYTNEYVSLYGADDKIDEACYNKSYGLTIYGNKDLLSGNQLNILIYLFRYFFYGSNIIQKYGE